MFNSFRRASDRLWSAAVPLVVLALCPFTLRGQETAAKPESKVEHFFGQFDFAVTGVGSFNQTKYGTNYLQQSVELKPSNTVGYMGTVQYIRKPLFGLEINYGYTRYSQNFTLGAGPAEVSGSPGRPATFYGVQANAKEYSAGYVIHAPKTYFKLKPFGSLGLGTNKFQPTAGGGYGLPMQYRALYYYDAGAETYLLGKHLGLKAEFRQSFFNAPDFLTNYLIIHKHTISTEPAVGVFLRF